MDLREKRIVFVTGKGGVGKSTIAAALAVSEAQKGRKTLLVELGDRSFYRYFFDLPGVEYHPKQIQENLFVARWNAESCLKEYVLHYLPLERVYKVFFQNRVMRAFINVAPAVSELAILGKITSGIRKIGPALDFDIIIVDAYATGHFQALLQAPKGLGEIIKTGPFGEQSKKIMEVVTNPRWTQVLIVALAESLPVSETQELYRSLRGEFDIVPRLLCNRLLEVPPHEATTNTPHEDVNLFLKYLAHVESRQNKYVDELRKTDPGLLRMPLILTTTKPADLLQALSQRMMKWTA